MSNNFQKMLNSKNKNVKLFADTVLDLSYSQGFYGRLIRDINDCDADDFDNTIKAIKKQNFTDAIDVIMWLEC